VILKGLQVKSSHSLPYPPRWIVLRCLASSQFAAGEAEAEDAEKISNREKYHTDRRYCDIIDTQNRFTIGKAKHICSRDTPDIAAMIHKRISERDVYHWEEEEKSH
jgi:hypothetical protein